jgi:glycosyltransferase involved in cell wall biosynthesis
MAGGVGRRRRSRSSTAPSVTIGMPVWNGEDFIAEAIDSVLGQTFERLTLVISDNASSDRTQAICEDYVRRDKRVRYQRLSRNIGLQGNFARLIDMADGPYFMWTGHDDRWHPAYVERMVAVLEDDPSIVLAGSNAASIDQSGVEWRRFDNVEVYGRVKGTAARARRFMAEPPGGGHATMVYGLMRTPAIQRIGFEPPGAIRNQHRGYYAMDLLTLYRLIFEGEFHVDPDTLYWRRDVLWSAEQWTASRRVMRSTERVSNTIHAVRGMHSYFANLRRITATADIDERQRQALVRATYREELRFQPAALWRLSGRIRGNLGRRIGWRTPTEPEPLKPGRRQS